VSLKPGARILCYSDGLIETQGPRGELFGLERAAQIAESAQPHEVFETLMLKLVEFRGDSPSLDDLSLVEVSSGATSG
jgi:serine phosphatase RsbU (regulator of sigma subunit)